MKKNSGLKTGWTITVNVTERLSESYYLVKDHYDTSANEDSLTLIKFPAELDIQVGETLTIDGNYIRTKDINFINNTGIVNLDRCGDSLSILYAKEISELSKDLKDYDFVIQVSKNETNIDENIAHYLDGYKWEMALNKQTIMCIAPPADLSPNTFFYGQSSQRFFYNKNIPKTSERLRWNAAIMIAKTIIPSKNVSKYDHDKIATWLIMRDKRFSLEHNRKLIDFIEGCRSFEFICGSNSQISLTMKEIKDKFLNEEYQGFQNEIVDVLGLKESHKKPAILSNKCHRYFIGLRDNTMSPSQAKKNIISSTYDTFYSTDKLSANMAIQLHYFMINSISFDSESQSNYSFYNNHYYKSINEYKNFCLQNDIQDKNVLDGLFINDKFLSLTKSANKKASCVQFFRKAKRKISIKKDATNRSLSTTLYSNKKWQMMPIQRQELLDSITNNELVNLLISQAKYIYGLVNEYIAKNIFSSNDRMSIRKEIVNLGALIAETQFGIDADTNKKREYYFHFTNRYFREDYVALLRSINFFDKILNNNVMMTFFDQLKCVLESIFAKDNYPDYKEIAMEKIINITEHQYG